MPPDFNKDTVSKLGKRAGYICSNPACRVLTAGPNTEPDKATVIGEAAHIYGARPPRKRFNPDMSDAERAEITNGIWLCRNCHKIVDDDEKRFPATVLFQWREEHDKYISSKLQCVPDVEPYANAETLLHEFRDYPPIIRRIILDKPQGWTFRLAAELMHHLNARPLQSLSDLRAGLYTKPIAFVRLEDFSDWFRVRMAELSNIVSPISGLLTELSDAMNRSVTDEAAIQDIHRCCQLISDNLERVVEEEQTLAFAKVPDECERLTQLLHDVLGSQFEKIRDFPDRLNDAVALLATDHGGTVENPLVVEHIVEFEMPEGWARKVEREFARLEKRFSDDHDTKNSGCSSVIVLLAVLGLLWLFL